MTSESPPSFTAALVFDDPTPNAVILHRIVQTPMEIASNFAKLDPGTGSDLADLILLIARKMVSVWRHLEAYRAEERRLVEQLESHPQLHVFSQELFLEFDGFTVQIKSSLDYLVKVLRPIVGRTWTLQTFGDKGNKVRSALRNLGKNYRGHVDLMDSVLFTETNLVWLKAVIESRDRINHFQNGGFSMRSFGVFKSSDGNVAVPMWSDDERLSTTMTILWENLFRYVEDFLVLAINMRVPDEWALTKTPQPVNSPDRVWHVVPRSTTLRSLKLQGVPLPPQLDRLV